MHKNADADKGQKMVSYLGELELQAVESHLLWVLAPELRSSLQEQDVLLSAELSQPPSFPSNFSSKFLTQRYPLLSTSHVAASANMFNVIFI